MLGDTMTVHMTQQKTNRVAAVTFEPREDGGLIIRTKYEVPEFQYGEKVIYDLKIDTTMLASPRTAIQFVTWLAKELGVRDDHCSMQIRAETNAPALRRWKAFWVERARRYRERARACCARISGAFK